MKSRILVLLFLLVFVGSCSKRESKSTEGNDDAHRSSGTAHGAVCMIFLGEDEKLNEGVLEKAAELTASRKHKAHTIVFPSETQQVQAVRDLIKAHGVKKFPAVLVDTKLTDGVKPLSLEVDQASQPKAVVIEQNLAVDVFGKNALVTIFYICCYGEENQIEDGRVTLYVVEKKKLVPNQPAFNVFRARIADSKDYFVEPGSCHMPENADWKIPPGSNPEQLKAVMVVYDGEGKVLGASCSDDACTERVKE